MKYRHIDACAGEYPKVLMCRVLGVTDQGYYQWRKRAPERAIKDKHNRIMSDRVAVAHAESRKTYGRVRVTRELREQSVPVY